jgi:hypothetical protein
VARLEKNYAEEGTFELFPNAEVQAQVQRTAFLHTAGSDPAAAAGAVPQEQETPSAASASGATSHRRPSIVTEDEDQSLSRVTSIVAVPVTLESAKFGNSLSSLQHSHSLTGVGGSRGATPTERSPLLVPANAGASVSSPAPKQPNGSAAPLPTYTPSDMV